MLYEMECVDFIGLLDDRCIRQNHCWTWIVGNVVQNEDKRLTDQINR